MSFFGVNIRKIRVAKKLSQKKFAELFDLTRSAVGAYEEGRAEAKIDKIVEIADYFGINLTSFLTKKLTLNEILNYDVNKVSKIWDSKFSRIILVEKTKIRQYIGNYNSIDYLKRLPKICFPDINEDYRAFEYEDAFHFLDNDILICSKYDNKPRKEDLYLLIDEEKIQVDNKISLKKRYLEIWRIEQVLIKSMHKVNLNMKLEQIKENIEKLKE